MNDCAVESMPTGQSAFGCLAHEIDQIETLAGERSGGPSFGEAVRIRALEGRLPLLQPQTVSDWRWLVRRLTRALENGWSDDMVVPLVRLVVQEF